jgi:hypothetical protein
MTTRSGRVQPRLIPRRRVLALLDDWAAAGIASVRCLVPGEPPDSDWDWLPDSMQKSGTGLALVGHAGGQRTAIAPPFPLPGPAADLAPLTKTLTAQNTAGVILIRLGHYAVGVADDEILLLPKSGRRYVHGRHRAGGQSQHRYEHNRDKWIRELFEEVCEAAATRFQQAGLLPAPGRPGPAASGSQQPGRWLALGGDRIVISAFLDRCDSLGPLKDRILPWRIPVERPNAEALHQAVTSVWSSRICTLPA